TPSTEHRIDRKDQRRVGGAATKEPSADFSDILISRPCDIGPTLEISRVFTALAIDDARMGGTHDNPLISSGGIHYALPHGRREAVEFDDIFDDLPRFARIHRLVVRCK